MAAPLWADGCSVQDLRHILMSSAWNYRDLHRFQKQLFLTDEKHIPGAGAIA